MQFIDHLSPSSLNTWISNPGLWSLKYLGGLKEDKGPAVARGSAVEAGMEQILHRREGAIETALDVFDANVMGEIADEIVAERLLIPGMVKQCQKWAQEIKDRPNAKQLKVEVWLDGVSVPIIGYKDFVFPNDILELKTTKACPSKPRPEHLRQISLYRKASNGMPGGILYVTDKRHAYYPVSDLEAEKAISELHSAAISLERFLSRFTNATDAIQSLPMNTDHPFFSKQAKQKLAEFYQSKGA